MLPFSYLTQRVRVALATGVVGSACVGYWIGEWEKWEGFFTLGLIGGGVILVLILIRKASMIESELRQVYAFENVRPLTGRLPLPLGRIGADPVLLDQVISLVFRKEVNTVVECGSGWSTVVLSSMFQELGRGSVVSLENVKDCFRVTNELLERYGCSERAHVVHAPLRSYMIEDEEWLWYSVDIDRLIDEPIDLLLVDGPSARIGQRARYPAVPLLRDFLSDDPVVVLDDGLRPGERWIAEKWSQVTGMKAHLVPHGKGIWCLGTTGKVYESDQPRETNLSDDPVRS